MANYVESEEEIAALVNSIARVAVLGIKTEAQSNQPAFYVPQYLQQAGIEVVPVPVYYPDVTHILGQPVYRTVAAVPGAVDLINVFRRPQDLERHVEDILAKAPRAVWLQLGIRNDVVADRLIAGGINVVQDRCLLVDHQRFTRKSRAP